jgi:hypothetical protein
LATCDALLGDSHHSRSRAPDVGCAPHRYRQDEITFDRLWHIPEDFGGAAIPSGYRVTFTVQLSKAACRLVTATALGKGFEPGRSDMHEPCVRRRRTREGQMATDQTPLVGGKLVE